jgi:hypothetical protein
MMASVQSADSLILLIDGCKRLYFLFIDYMDACFNNFLFIFT